MPTTQTERSALDPGEIDFGLVVNHIRDLLPDVTVHAGHSGGGCSTIYLGNPWYLRHDGTIHDTDDGKSDWLYPVIAGPGWVDDRRYDGVGHVDEFSAGYDANDPDTSDDYVSFTDDGHDERLIAQAMVNLYRNHPRIAA